MIPTVEDFITNDTKLIELEDQQYNPKELVDILNIDEKTLSLWNNWYNIQGKWYYYKSAMPGCLFFNELLGVELAKYFDLDTVNYQIAFQKLNIDRNDPFYKDYPLYGYGLISENFREKDKEYLSPADLGYSFFKDTDIKDSNGKAILKDLSIIELLRCDTEENYNELIRNIIKLSVLDFYMQQEDRCDRNILFSKDKSNYIQLAKVFDFEDSFAKCSSDYGSSLLLINLDNKQTLEMLRNNPIFQEQFYNLMNVNMQDVIERVHDKYKLRMIGNFIKDYFDHDKKIKNLVKEYQII